MNNHVFRCRVVDYYCDQLRKMLLEYMSDLHNWLAVHERGRRLEKAGRAMSSMALPLNAPKAHQPYLMKSISRYFGSGQ